MSVDLVSLSPAQALGIPVALFGSVVLAVSAQLQQRGVTKVSAAAAPTKRAGLSVRDMIALARRPSWLLGSALAVLAIACQLFSLYLAPLTVVQPLGAAALVITTLLNARVTHTRPSKAAIRAIVLCVGGIAVFVTVASFTTSTVAIHDTQLIVVLVILVLTVGVLGGLFLRRRRRLQRLYFVIASGVLFGFVATLAKVLITRLQGIASDGFRLQPSDWLSVACFLGLILAGLLGTYFSQTAYAGGSPQVVVAGLTVIDPLVGVLIGILVLGEATSAPLWVGVVFVLAGGVAVLGVLRLSRTSRVARTR